MTTPTDHTYNDATGDEAPVHIGIWHYALEVASSPAGLRLAAGYLRQIGSPAALRMAELIHDGLNKPAAMERIELQWSLWFRANMMSLCLLTDAEVEALAVANEIPAGLDAEGVHEMLTGLDASDRLPNWAPVVLTTSHWWHLALESAGDPEHLDDVARMLRQIGSPAALRMVELIRVGNDPIRIELQFTRWMRCGLSSYGLLKPAVAEALAEANEIPAGLDGEAVHQLLLAVPIDERLAGWNVCQCS